MNAPFLIPPDPMQLRTARGYNFGEVSSAMQKAVRRADVKLAGYCGEQSWEPLPDLAARKELNNRMLELFGSVERKSAGPKNNQRGYSNVAFKNGSGPSTSTDLFDEDA